MGMQIDWDQTTYQWLLLIHCCIEMEIVVRPDPSSKWELPGDAMRPHQAVLARKVKYITSVPCGALEAGLSRLPCGSCRGMQLLDLHTLAELSHRRCFKGWCLHENFASRGG